MNSIIRLHSHYFDLLSLQVNVKQNEDEINAKYNEVVVNKLM